jgi:DNA primase
VINPFATGLQLPPKAHKIRRLHELFQYFVQTITVLNQYSRETKNGKLITAKEDVQTAINVMFESIILKVDELDGSLRSFYENLKDYIKGKGEDTTFTAREIRLNLLLSKTQLHRYLNDLLELEYIEKAMTGGRNTFNYKISYWDNIEKLRAEIKEYLNKQLEKL